jgi:RNA polymerase sigma factor (sigma-70 family)
MEKDDETLHAFLTTRYLHLRRSAFLMCGDWALAAELTEITLARLVTDSRRGDVVDPDTYAYADLMAAFQHRRARREHVFVAPPDRDDSTDQADRILILAKLSRLSPRCRAVLVLRHWDGFGVQETADMLGVSTDRVAAHEAAGMGVLDVLLDGLAPAATR